MQYISLGGDGIRLSINVIPRSYDATIAALLDALVSAPAHQLGLRKAIQYKIVEELAGGGHDLGAIN